MRNNCRSCSLWGTKQWALNSSPVTSSGVQIDRFLVSDPRPTEEVEAQRSVQKLIRKAFREAKAAKQKAKEKARAARAQAAKEQAAAVRICFE